MSYTAKSYEDVCYEVGELLEDAESIQRMLDDLSKRFEERRGA